MRFLDMQRSLWRWSGKPDSVIRTNDFIQECKDALNQSMDFIKQHSPFWWNDVEEADVSVVANTMSYELSDFCYVPMEFWINGIVPHHMVFLQPSQVDMLGLRGTDMYESAYGPYRYTFAPSRKTSLLTGTCDITEGAQAVTAGSGVFTTAMSNKRIRFRGEEEDYVFTRTGNTTGTIDRPYRSRRYGTDTQAPSGAQTGITFDVSPGPVWTISFVPMPVATLTARVRYVKRWSRMINDEDVPANMEERIQHLLLDCAKLKMMRYFGVGGQERQAEYSIFEKQFDRALINAIGRDEPTVGPTRVIPTPRYLDYANPGSSRDWPMDRDPGRGR